MAQASDAQQTLERRDLKTLVATFEQGLHGTLWGLVLFGSAARGEADEGFFWQWKKAPTGHWRIDWSGVYGL